MVVFLKAHPSIRALLVEKTDRLYRNLKDWVTIAAGPVCGRSGRPGARRARQKSSTSGESSQTKSGLSSGAWNIVGRPTITPGPASVIRRPDPNEQY
jgi:hypothetical protein